jgi:hypothetical protein
MVIMERDSNAPRSGYSAQSYMEALTKGLLPYWRRSHLFMQDGAGIHRARVIKSFFQQRMHKHYPQYNNLSQAEKEWEGFCEALKSCWRSILSSLIKRLIMSMPWRLEACRNARGWQTKY